jgi:outer membrane protein assembly factor BamA
MQKNLFLIITFYLFHPSLNGQEGILSDSLKVQQINIEGNHITSKKVIYRELVFKINSIVARKDIESIKETSINNLTKTSLFNFIDVFTTEIISGVLTVEVKLTERWFIWPTGYLNQTDRNFNEWWRHKDLNELEYGIGVKVNNFRGMGETLEMKYHIGSINRYDFEYDGIHLDKSEHHYLSLHSAYIALGNVPWAIESNQQVILKSGSKLLNSGVVEIKYTYRREYFNFHTISIGFSDNRAADTILKLNPYFFGFNNQRQRYFELGYEFSRDTRDSHFYPKTGYLIVAGITKKGLGILPSEYNSIDISMSLFEYRKLINRVYIASGFMFTSTSNNDKVFYSQVGLGYLQYLRGYEYYVVNGDKTLLFKTLLNYELLPKKVLNLKFWPFRKAYQFNKIPIEIYTNLFFDAGYVYDKTDVYRQYNNTLVNKLISSAGAGVDFITYYDKILRFDYAFTSIGGHGLFIHWKAAIR